ncbi:hypothetical protein BC833DRAFT_611667 [Globomyces pollinis-pini]|nr:hypothetical protein BC833DRAFT_611667 [Globomyces pollinis-pini]
MKAKFRNKNSRKADDTTKIPSQLLEQLQTDQDSRFKFRFVKSNRKELRKASRKEKKVNKNHHHVDQQPKNIVKTPSKSNLKEKLISQPSSKPISKAVEKVNLQIQKKKELEKQKRQLSKLQTSNPALFKVLTDNHLISTQDLQKSGLIPEVSLDEDTKTIEDYSKKLKLKNGKLNQSFKRDGLDFLLEDLGEAGSDNDDMLLSNDDVSSDNGHLETDSDHSDVDENMSETDQFSMEGDINMDSEEDDDVMEVDFDNADAFDDDSTSDLESSLGEIIEKPVSIKPKIDIYGQSTGMTGAYVPPHLRKSSNNQNEKYIRLQRQIQGLLNRLSDANIESIVSGLQDCLLENPRHDVTEIITDLVLSYIGDHANLLDSFSATYACLLAVLYHTIGLEFGAHFIQTLVERFEKERLSAIQESEASKRVSKQCTNYVTLLGFLYNFNVVGCILIYDLIKMAISQLSELDVEILLRLIRISGSQIRSDDPSSLKDIIVLIKEEMAKRDQKSLSVRLKFMVENIMDLKNNKKKNQNIMVQNQIQQASLKKVLTMITQKKGLHIEPLRVSLNDIQNVAVKGKWWLVGASWKGIDSKEKEEKVTKALSSDNQNQLMKLAKSQKMNTDVRKSIFVVLMSSEDCIDAHERLLKLNLKDKQERDIIRVLFHCCQQEQIYNPYYSLVAQQFCHSSHGFKITIQYTLWDAFKTMDNDEMDDERIVNGISNIGKLIGDLISSESISLSILKVRMFPLTFRH